MVVLWMQEGLAMLYAVISLPSLQHSCQLFSMLSTLAAAPLLQQLIQFSHFSIVLPVYISI